MFRITHLGKEIDEAESLDGARLIVECQEVPGRYAVDRFLSQREGWRMWGHLFLDSDGLVQDQPYHRAESGE